MTTEYIITHTPREIANAATLEELEHMSYYCIDTEDLLNGANLLEAADRNPAEDYDWAQMIAETYYDDGTTWTDVLEAVLLAEAIAAKEEMEE